MKKAASWLIISAICLTAAIPAHAETNTASNLGSAVGTAVGNSIASGLRPVLDGSSEIAGYGTVTGPTAGRSDYAPDQDDANGHALAPGDPTSSRQGAVGVPPSAGAPPVAPGYAITGLYGPTGNAKVTYPHRASIYSRPLAVEAAGTSFDWDWLGWLGLLGLVGIFGRNGQGRRT